MEQKNWRQVRKLPGWEGYDSPAAGIRLHLECLDGHRQSYIFKWLDTNWSRKQVALRRLTIGKSSSANKVCI